MAERAKQYMRVYGYMKAHGSITQNQATEALSCTDLAGAIYKLKKHGYYTTSWWVDGTNKFGEPVRFKRYALLEQEGE